MITAFARSSGESSRWTLATCFSIVRHPTSAEKIWVRLGADSLDFNRARPQMRFGQIMGQFWRIDDGEHDRKNQDRQSGRGSKPSANRTPNSLQATDPTANIV